MPYLLQVGQQHSLCGYEKCLLRRADTSREIVFEQPYPAENLFLFYSPRRLATPVVRLEKDLISGSRKEAPILVLITPERCMLPPSIGSHDNRRAAIGSLLVTPTACREVHEERRKLVREGSVSQAFAGTIRLRIIHMSVFRHLATKAHTQSFAFIHVAQHAKGPRTVITVEGV